jgi:hypothetical protein
VTSASTRPGNVRFRPDSSSSHDRPGSTPETGSADSEASIRPKRTCLHDRSFQGVGTSLNGGSRNREGLSDSGFHDNGLRSSYAGFKLNPDYSPPEQSSSGSESDGHSGATPTGKESRQSRAATLKAFFKRQSRSVNGRSRRRSRPVSTCNGSASSSNTEDQRSELDKEQSFNGERDGPNGQSVPLSGFQTANGERDWKPRTHVSNWGGRSRYNS